MELLLSCSLAKKRCCTSRAVRFRSADVDGGLVVAIQTGYGVGQTGKAKYIGASTGLALRNLIKYLLSKRYVFMSKR
jgi:hypothetical protein